MDTRAFQAEEWRPGSRTVILWMVLGMPLLLFGIFIFGIAYAAPRGGTATVELPGPLVGASILVPTFVLHELLHGLAMSRYGARPTYGAGIYHKVLPYLYCTANGHRFTRTQFAIVCVAPVALISFFGAFCVAFISYGSWLIVPLGIHLAGCIGDFWMLALAYRQPRGTLFEDLKTGVRILRPAA